MKSNKNKKQAQETIYAFIDSQNLNLGIRSQGWQLDFRKFRIYLEDKFNVKKAFLFIGYLPENEKLYNNLKEYDYRLIFKPVVHSSKQNKLIKGNVDAELVLHSMIEIQNYDGAIIVSGDGDFYCLIKYLISKKKLSRIIIPNRRGFSSLLWEFKNYIERMEGLKKKLEYKKGRRA